MSTELPIPYPLNKLPMRTTMTPENEWQQTWRQVGWLNMRTFEVLSMDADRSTDGPWTELWILAIDATMAPTH